jgi:hypothetical protein
MKLIVERKQGSTVTSLICFTRCPHYLGSMEVMAQSKLKKESLKRLSLPPGAVRTNFIKVDETSILVPHRCGSLVLQLA